MMWEVVAKDCGYFSLLQFGLRPLSDDQGLLYVSSGPLSNDPGPFPCLLLLFKANWWREARVPSSSYWHTPTHRDGIHMKACTFLCIYMHIHGNCGGVQVGQCWQEGLDRTERGFGVCSVEAAGCLPHGYQCFQRLPHCMYINTDSSGSDRTSSPRRSTLGLCVQSELLSPSAARSGQTAALWHRGGDPVSRTGGVTAQSSLGIAEGGEGLHSAFLMKIWEEAAQRPAWTTNQ